MIFCVVCIGKVCYGLMSSLVMLCIRLYKKWEIFVDFFINIDWIYMLFDIVIVFINVNEICVCMYYRYVC